MIRPTILRAHRLKCWPNFFDLHVRGIKTCEVRRADRDYRTDDYLLLVEFDPQSQTFAAASLWRRITHILWPADAPNGLRGDFVVLSVLPVSFDEGRLLDRGETLEWIEP